MKYGLLTDIHEAVDFLRMGLARFDREGVDRVIVLGDVFETGRHLEESANLLADAGAVGVWGNHDFGLSRDPSESVRARFSARCMAFMGSLRPTLELGDCLITHVSPWRDAEDIFELWSFGQEDDAARCFAARPHRIMLHGHHHRWKVTTPSGPVQWNWLDPLLLAPGERYLIEVGALCDGRCAVFEPGADILRPIDLRDGD